MAAHPSETARPSRTIQAASPVPAPPTASSWAVREDLAGRDDRALLSLGHDECWSLGERRAAVTAHDHGVNIVFFAASPILRHIRVASSRLGPDRLEIAYRDSAADPLNLIGIVTSPPRVPSTAANRVTYLDGKPVAALRGGEVIFLATVSEETADAVAAALGQSARARATSVR